MKTCALLTCKDLSGFEHDDELLLGPFKEAGWESETIIWDGQPDWNKFDAAIIRSTWDYTHHYEKFKQVILDIENSTCQLFNSPSLVKWNGPKTYLRDLEKNGTRIIPTLWYDQLPERIEDILIKLDSTEIILKPQVSASANDTFRIKKENLCSQEESIRSALSTKAFMAQPFMPKVLSHGEFSLFYFNGNYSHSVRKTPKSGDFRVQEEHGGIIESYLPSVEQKEEADLILKRLPEIPLYARVDGVLDDHDKFNLMELELIEPALYLRTDPVAVPNFVTAFLERV